MTSDAVDVAPLKDEGYVGAFAQVRRRSLGQLLLWALRRRMRIRIRGSSMEPTFLDSDEVLVDCRAFARRSPKIGEVVLMRHPFKGNVTMVKRIARRVGENRYFVMGDNADESTDSRSFGPVTADLLMGPVTAHFV